MCGEISYSQFLKGMLAEHGAFAVVAIMFGLVIWNFLLVPMSEDRKLFIAVITETSRQNAHHIEEMNHAAKVTKEAMVSMQAAVDVFTNDMWRTHPEQTRKLDEILYKLEELK